MACALYNRLYPGHAESAGTKVDEPGQHVVDRKRAKNVIIVMNEIGIDISQNRRRQLQKSDIKNYDKVIMMAESETVPEYMNDESAVTFWNVDDPANMDIIDTRKIREKLKVLIDEL